MNLAIIQELIGKALAKEITFREILATLGKEGVESYHVDFLRNEFRYYATNGESLATSAALLHDGSRPTFPRKSSKASTKEYKRDKRHIRTL